MPTIDDVRNRVWLDHKPPLKEETPEQTLDRLWEKHRGSRESKFGKEFVSGSLEALTEENTSVDSEQLPSDELGRLLDREKSMPPKGGKNTPVVIIRYQGRNSLLDGGKRVTKWCSANPPTIHEAWVIEVIT